MGERRGGGTLQEEELFKYLGRSLEQSDDYWPEDIWNIRKALQVWSILGVILRREGADPIVSGIFT